jgi:site-specific DNA recombinase
LDQALNAPDSRTEAAEILRGIIERINVTPIGRGAFEIDLVGDIVNMIDLAQRPKQPKTAASAEAAVPDAYRSSVKVVAGAGNKRQTTKRLLTGLVKCGCCGGSMTIVNRNRYYCSAKRERGTCDSAVGIKAQDLEDRVLTGLKDILIGNEDLIKTFADAFKAEVTRLRKERGSRDRKVQNDLNKVDMSIRRCMTFITEGDGDPGIVRDELRSLEARKRDLERALSASREDSSVEMHPNIGELYAKKVGELPALLTDDTTRPQAMDIIRSLIDRVEVTEGVERGKPDVVLVGTLAAILAFTQNNTAALISENGGGVLLVAGVGSVQAPTIHRTV